MSRRVKAVKTTAPVPRATERQGDSSVSPVTPVARRVTRYSSAERGTQRYTSGIPSGSATT